MLEHVRILNFCSLRSVAVDLKPFTVLIGKNDTGKSSFLRALEIVGSGDPRPSLARREVWWRHGPDKPEIHVRVAGRFHTLIPGERLKERLPAGRLFSLPRDGPAMRSQGVSGVPEIQPDGSGVPTLLDYFLRQDRRRFDSFVANLRAHMPGLEDVNVPTPDASQRAIELTIDGGFKIPADAASAGVRLLIFFVALAHHPNPPDLVLIEEPENGLHPKRLADVVKLLKKLTRGEIGGKEVQVVLTTHSTYLLDEVNLDADQVLVFRRSADGSRTAEAVDRERLKTFLDEFKLGEVWFNRDEEGLLKRASESPAKTP